MIDQYYLKRAEELTGKKLDIDSLLTVIDENKLNTNLEIFVINCEEKEKLEEELKEIKREKNKNEKSITEEEIIEKEGAKIEERRIELDNELAILAYNTVSTNLESESRMKARDKIENFALAMKKNDLLDVESAEMGLSPLVYNAAFRSRLKDILDNGFYLSTNGVDKNIKRTNNIRRDLRKAVGLDDSKTIVFFYDDYSMMPKSCRVNSEEFEKIKDYYKNLINKINEYAVQQLTDEFEADEETIAKFTHRGEGEQAVLDWVFGKLIRDAKAHDKFLEKESNAETNVQKGKNIEDDDDFER